MHHYNEQLDLLMTSVKDGQMKRFEYEYVANFLGNKNFLVFGTGYDTKFWKHCNQNGYNVFLEHDPKWILEDSADIFLVNYTCYMTDYKKLLADYKNGCYDSLKINIPDHLYNIDWDIIFVDGPPGNKKNSIGRMQSIFMSKILSNKNTEIFIHDCDRTIEDLFSKEMFIVKKQLEKLRHCKNEI
jgi:uncharacterized protein (TIGR01627 family)